MPEDLIGPWLLTATSLTFAGLAIACFVTYVLNKKLPYDSDVDDHQPGSAANPRVARWRLFTFLCGAFWLVMITARFALHSTAPSGAEWFQAGAVAAVVTGFVAQGSYLLGVLANPDKD